MPHVVIEGPISPERVHRELAPFDVRDACAIYRLRESFLSRQGHLALLETVVVEGSARRFFLAVDQRPGGLTLRIHPIGDLEKTAGVKRAIARVALRIQALDPALRLGPTNLEAELRSVAEREDGSA